jgi:Resolvase, N terminal domain
MNNTTDRNRRAVVYLRLANIQGSSSAVIDAQRAICEQISKRYGAVAVREYIDLGKPARLEQQTELSRLLTELDAQRDVAFVVVSDYARLARDLTSLDAIIERIEACGAKVVTLTGVEVAERFIQGGLADQRAERTNLATQPPRYPLALLRAARRGLGPHQTLVVIAMLPSGETIHGQIAGIGSRLGITTIDGRLIENVRADWIISVVMEGEETFMKEGGDNR